MRSLVSAALVAFLFTQVVSLVRAQDQSPAIQIKSITANQSIEGVVLGISDPRKIKIIVYLKTDRWYLHPYADRDEGESWAKIDRGGYWSLPTVKRAFKATAIAALVVPMSFDAPGVVDNPKTLPAAAYYQRDLIGTPDYGKL